MERRPAMEGRRMNIILTLGAAQKAKTKEASDAQNKDS
jgi:hypothetical protein